MNRKSLFVGPLPVPSWKAHHGEISEGWAGEVRCRRHFTLLGRGSAVRVCPQCDHEAREHERATRDD